MQSKRRLKHWLPLTVSLTLFAVVILGGFLGSQTSWARQGVTVALAPAKANAAKANAAFAPALINADFEGGFHEHAGVGELTIADGWSPWYSESGGRHRPEYKAEVVGVGEARVYHGEKAQKQFTTFSAQDGGIYQRIEGVTPGEWYTFEAWTYVWSSSADDPNYSVRPGKYSVLVGINPWGDTDGLARTTVWGKEALEIYDDWIQVSITAQAWSENIVVFTRGVAVWGVKHNDSYWDLLSFAEVPGPGTPQPTYTPYPTPGAGAVDYERIEDIVLTTVAGREPVRWPR